MNAEQLAEIRPAIREAIDGAPDTCVTLQVEGDSDRWVQVKDFLINVAYPFDDEPESRLKGLPFLPGIKTTIWERKKFATFQVEEIRLSSVAEWIDAYFVRVLGCTPGDYHVDASFEKQ